MQPSARREIANRRAVPAGAALLLWRDTFENIVDQQDTEGRARTPRDVRHDARAPGQALGLRATVRQLQDPLDAGLHVAGRVQEGGAVPPGIVQIGVANPAKSQLAKHVYRIKERAGCTLEEIARALTCSVAEAVQTVIEVTPRRPRGVRQCL